MHIAVMEITAETIKTARLKLGETQAAFASRFGVNQSTVHHWETKGPPDEGTALVALQFVLSGLSIGSAA